MSDFQSDSERIGRILKDGDYNLNTSQRLFRAAERKAGLVEKKEAKCPDAMSLKEAEALVESAYRTDQRYGIMVQIFLETGCRVPEFREVERRDIKLIQGTRFINLTCPKTGKSRSMPITESLRFALNHYLDETTGQVLFPHLQPPDSAPERIHDILQQIAEKAGIDRCVTSYHLRQTFASLVKNQAVQQSTVRNALGHSDVKFPAVHPHQVFPWANQ